MQCLLHYGRFFVGAAAGGFGLGTGAGLTFICRTSYRNATDAAIMPG
jgi:hypothetical protein